MRTIELQRIKAKIALNQELTEYERCYFLLLGKWEDVHKFLEKEKIIIDNKKEIKDERRKSNDSSKNGC